MSDGGSREMAEQMTHHCSRHGEFVAALSNQCPVCAGQAKSPGRPRRPNLEREVEHALHERPTSGPAEPDLYA